MRTKKRSFGLCSMLAVAWLWPHAGHWFGRSPADQWAKERHLNVQLWKDGKNVQPCLSLLDIVSVYDCWRYCLSIFQKFFIIVQWHITTFKPKAFPMCSILVSSSGHRFSSAGKFGSQQVILSTQARLSGANYRCLSAEGRWPDATGSVAIFSPPALWQGISRGLGWGETQIQYYLEEYLELF